LHDCRCLCRPRAARQALSRSEAGGTVEIRWGAESVMVESRNQRGFTNGSANRPNWAHREQANFSQPARMCNSVTPEQPGRF
jgi:hypothetical protein